MAVLLYPCHALWNSNLFNKSPGRCSCSLKLEDEHHVATTRFCSEYILLSGRWEKDTRLAASYALYLEWCSGYLCFPYQTSA